MNALNSRVSVNRDQKYCIPKEVQPVDLHGRIQLTTFEGGRIWIDLRLFELWEAAEGKSLNELMSDPRFLGWGDNQILSGIICLVEAGLLERLACQPIIRDRTSVQGGLVSIIIVSYNSRKWLQECLESVADQNYTPVEIIVVDNASIDGTADWMRENYPAVVLFELTKICSLAKALNMGIQNAAGEFIVLLNPDVKLDNDAIKQMVKVACENPSCAAVAAKLNLLWAPAFLNGLGNMVGAFAWGSDIGLGHLDLGQFDHWREIPSACFAATLIPRSKFDVIGLLDEGFSMYYEDSEWCYRARVYGNQILAAPQARCLHAFGSLKPGEGIKGLSSQKLRRVSYGRLRFITRINSSFYFWRFLINYLLEDILRGFIYFFTARWKMNVALLRGWGDYLAALPEILSSRKKIQSRRRITDRDIFGIHKNLPAPLIQAGIPILTWDAVCSEYAPLILSGKTREFPEFSINDNNKGDRLYYPASALTRYRAIWKDEGAAQLLYKVARQLQWWLVKL